MESYVLYFPLTPEDLERLEGIVERAALFRTGFPDLADKEYRAATYRVEEAIHGTICCMLVDRNVMSRISGLVRGDRASEEHRLAAAAMAFAQCANILIEPNWALYELAHGGQLSEAFEELARFRLAEGVEPNVYADIAFGRRDTIPQSSLPAERSDENPEELIEPLARWRSNYILALQVAVLELRGGTAEHKMVQFMRWMRNEFVFGASATLFAMRYFAPGGQRRRMLKSLRGANRDAGLRGVRNAAWDLNLVTEWVRNVKLQANQSSLWILCSRDASVGDLASDILCPESSGLSTEELAARLFARYWGEERGGRLFQEYIDCARDFGSPSRDDHGRNALQRKDALITALEGEVLGWSPNRS